MKKQQRRVCRGHRGMYEAGRILKAVVDGIPGSLGEARLLFYGVCPLCGKEFDKKRIDQEFCSQYHASYHRAKKIRALKKSEVEPL